MSKREIQEMQLRSTRFKQRKLIARRIDDELLIFEEETSTAHCLNAIAGEMWMACERQSSAIDVTEALRPRWPDVEEEVVWASLSQMANAKLLEETTDQETISTSRRALVRKLGITAAVVLPIVVTSVLVPPAYAAASCGKTGALCGEGHPLCCAGYHCVLGTLVCVQNT